MPVNISTSDLVRFSQQSNVELRVEGQDENEALQSPEGTLGGRIMRWYKQTFTDENREDKQAKYMKAGVALHQALAREYGDKIANTAYQAGTGHSHLAHQSSSPITGRQIAKMLDTAQRELRREDPYREISFAPKSFTDLKGKAITLAPTLMWFQHSEKHGRSPSETDWEVTRGKRHDIDRLQHEGQSGVSGFKKGGFVPTPLPNDAGPLSGKTLEVGDRLAQQLLGDAQLQSQDGADRHYWQLTSHPRDGGPGTVIGLRIDRQNPDIVHVFDARHGEYSVPKDGLTSWLGQHLKDDRGPLVHQLERIEQKPLTGRFVEFTGQALDDTVRLDQVNRNKRDGLEQLGHSSELQPRPDSPPLAKQFLLDVERQTMMVKSQQDDGVDGRSLTLGNCGTEMLALVDGAGDDQQKERAAGNLSQLVGQSALNFMTSAFHGSLRDGNLNTLNPIVTGAGRARTVEIGRCRMDDGRPGIEITHRSREPLLGLQGVDDPKKTSPDTDYLQDKMTIQVALDDLVNAQEMPPYTVTQQPIREYHVENPPSPGKAEGDLKFRPSINNQDIHVLALDDILPETYQQDWLDRLDERFKSDRFLRQDNDRVLSEHCLETMITTDVTIRVGDGRSQRPGLRDIDQSLSDAGLSEQEIREVSRFVDSKLLTSLTCDVGRSLGLDESAFEYFLAKPTLNLHIQRGDDGKLVVSLSADISRLLDNAAYESLGGLPDDRTGQRLSLGARFQLDVQADKVTRTLLPPPLLQFGPQERIKEGYAFARGVLDKEFRLDAPRMERVREDLARDLRLPDAPYQSVSQTARQDVGRGNTVTVNAGQGVATLMTSDNIEELLGDLVGNDNDEETRRAVRRLSQLLPLDSTSAILAPGREGLTRDFFATKGSGNPRIDIVRQQDFLEITVSSTNPLNSFRVDGDLHGASGLTDSFTVAGKIRISLAALRGLDNPVPEIGSLRSHLHIEGYRGLTENYNLADPRNDLPDGRKAHQRVEITERDGVLIGDIAKVMPPGNKSWANLRQQVDKEQLFELQGRQFSLTGFEGMAKGGFGDGRPPWEPDLMDGPIRGLTVYNALTDRLGNQGGQLTGQLSRLINAEFMNEMFRQTAMTMGAVNDHVNALEDKGLLSIDATRDGDWVTLTLTKNADSLLTPVIETETSRTSEVLGSRGITQETHTADLTVQMRVRVQDLLDGHPERFEVVHGPRLEFTGIT